MSSFMGKPTHKLEKQTPYVKSHTQSQNSQKDFQNLVSQFWQNNPYVKDVTRNHELEVRFGTRGIKPLTKVDFDNVVRKLKSLGFTCANEQGNYMLRIQNEFLDPGTGSIRMSDIRTEIIGFNGIQEYCKHNDLKKLIANDKTVEFYKKAPYRKDGEKVWPVNFDDFNFRVSYQTEDRIYSTNRIISSTLNSWDRSKKTFRYINRVTFTHPDIPVNVDISIVKSSTFEKGQIQRNYTTEESGVFSNPEVYEVELEVNNSAIGPGTVTNTAEELIASIRKAIKYVLMGLQETNYPISYNEQKNVLMEYMKLIHQENFSPEKRVYPSHFIGPSSYTLQTANIATVNENAKIPNIRKDYTVTDKADGERNMMFIPKNGGGKIYLINTNMKVLFTGARSDNPEIYGSLIDGEIIIHDKFGKFINLYAAFDVYYIKNVDVRPYGFIPKKDSDIPNKSRLPILKNLIKGLKPVSIVPNSSSPMKIECKKFYPSNPSIDNIFDACKYILEREKEGLYEYNTDGLIFTPANMGVGTDSIGKPSPNNKTTWDFSFKWKPAQFNTIDFLVTTKKGESGTDLVTPIFQDGMNALEMTQFTEYKTMILRCGFDERKHGFLNPCNDVINDILPTFGDKDNETNYKPVQFFPTNPFDMNAGISNIILKKDETGMNQMYTEENEAFSDNTIVEFRYEINNEQKWKWIPLRVRYDKTTRLRQGQSEFGNAYHVANSNWHSIHNPVTIEMISTGSNIPDELADDDVYYNRFSKTTNTAALRDFHNLYVKNLLITSVAKKGDILIDYACGKGGDFPKWIKAELSFVFGIDVSKDNLENRLDGACARFLNYRRDFKSVPYALFVHGNSNQNIRSGAAMLNDRAIHTTRAIFGQGQRNEEKLGKGVARQYGKGEDGFHISSCQFALHYFFESSNTLQNFIRNIAECTRLGGYFIGTCYDGKLIFNMLKNKKNGESVELYSNDVKMWEVQKNYDDDEFPDDINSVGYKIGVYQESINKMFSEYLVNFDYLNRVMGNYGFALVMRDEARLIGLPEGSGLFSELFNNMQEEVKRYPNKSKMYGAALKMNAYEKKIAFLNRYFVYKKIVNVNAENIVLDEGDIEFSKRKVEKPITLAIIEKNKEGKEGKEDKTIKTKPKVRKLAKKMVLVEGETLGLESSVNKPTVAVVNEILTTAPISAAPIAVPAKRGRPRKLKIID